MNMVILQIVSPEKSDMYQLFYDTGKGFNETELVRYARYCYQLGFPNVEVKESLLPEQNGG